MELEYKSIPLEIKQITDKGVFIGLASPYNNIDDGMDRVASSIGPTNDGKTVPILYQHDTTKVLGNQTLKNTPAGIQTTGQLILDKDSDGQYLVPLAAEAYALLKKNLLKLSIGYKTLKYEYVVENGERIRNLLDIQIMEVSLVTFPMNESAVISSVKSQNIQNINGGDNVGEEIKGASGSTSLPMADKSATWDGAAAAKRIFDKYTDKDGNISAEARKGFFWFDSTKPNNKTSYKLGFADIVDDKLTAIPAGVLAAANAIRGARNPVDIPEADKKKCATKINSYLKKLEYDEITDDQIKGEKPKAEPKASQTNPEVKALGFNAVYQTRQNREARWDAESALDQSLDSIAQDETMSVEDKVTASNNTIDEFGNMYKQIMSGLIIAMSQKSLNLQFETKSQYIERMEIKAGKKISKANKEKISRCKDSASDLISLLTELLSSTEDMPDDGCNEEDDSKACGTKKPMKSTQTEPESKKTNKNIQNKQNIQNSDTIELKGFTKELEGIASYFNKNKEGEI